MIEDQAIFLDLCRDRYFSLDGAAADAFTALRTSSDGLSSNEVAETLLATGLFTPSDKPSSLLPPQIEVAERDLLEDGAKPRFKDLFQVLFLLIGYRCAVRHQPLERVMARHRRLRADRSGTVSPVATLALAQRFLRARGLIPIKPICLHDSLALHDWLATRGAHASLVLGVRLDPFAAHSWVQLGEFVLNDAYDRVTAYTPILVVE